MRVVSRYYSLSFGVERLAHGAESIAQRILKIFWVQVKSIFTAHSLRSFKTRRPQRVERKAHGVESIAHGEKNKGFFMIGTPVKYARAPHQHGFAPCRLEKRHRAPRCGIFDKRNEPEKPTCPRLKAGLHIRFHEVVFSLRANIWTRYLTNNSQFHQPDRIYPAIRLLKSCHRQNVCAP